MSKPSFRTRLLASAAAAALALGGMTGALLGVCGPFTDVAADVFCPFVLEIFYLGITTGTTATTYDPAANVTRLQMAAFLSRTVDSALKRGSRRAALGQFWNSQNGNVLGITTLPGTPQRIASDGADIWVPVGDTVVRVRASDGRILETWTGAVAALAVLPAIGRILVVGETSPGSLYVIDPSQAAGAVTTVASNLGNDPLALTFDGSRFWAADLGAKVSIITPGATIPWTVTDVVSVNFNGPDGAVFDGANVWITDLNKQTLMKLDAAGAVLQTITLGFSPQHPTFDGANIWVPNEGSDSVSVVRASNGTVLATLTGTGLSEPNGAAFDGQRVLVPNLGNHSVSLFKAADLTPIGNFTLGSGFSLFDACSDGVSFWISIQTANALARF